MNVADILASKGNSVIKIRPSDTIGMLSERLREKRVGAAVVSSDGSTIDGVITERDVTFGLAVHKAGLYALPVSELMTKTVIKCAPRDNIALVASTMIARHIRHIPVEDDGQIVGMVSIRDVLNLRVDELQQHTAMLRTFVAQADREPEDR